MISPAAIRFTTDSSRRRMWGTSPSSMVAAGARRAGGAGDHKEEGECPASCARPSARAAGGSEVHAPGCLCGGRECSPCTQAKQVRPRRCDALRPRARSNAQKKKNWALPSPFRLPIPFAPQLTTDPTPGARNISPLHHSIGPDAAAPGPPARPGVRHRGGGAVRRCRLGRGGKLEGAAEGCPQAAPPAPAHRAHPTHRPPPPRRLLHQPTCRSARGPLRSSCSSAKGAYASPTLHPWRRGAQSGTPAAARR